MFGGREWMSSGIVEGFEVDMKGDWNVLYGWYGSQKGLDNS